MSWWRGVDGAIGEDEAAWLAGIVLEMRPAEALEVGVASGRSSVALLAAMTDWGGRLTSYDVTEECWGAPKGCRTGDGLREVRPDLVHRWTLRIPAASLDAGREHRGVRLAFIDADHTHPAPTDDLINLLPALELADCAVVLHDIALPRIRGRWTEYGAQVLFDEWTGEKARIGTGNDNIGVLRIHGWGEREAADVARAIARK